MISLRPVSEENLRDFEGTSYGDMTQEEKRSMLRESLLREHEGAYFELLAVCDGPEVVGFMSLYAASKHVICVGPEIKLDRRGRGYAFKGELLALRMARDAGYTVAVAMVREDNAASMALHEKLGFEKGAQCLSKRGKPALILVKSLLSPGL